MDNNNNICCNFAYDTFINGTHGCNCQTGWTGQWCNTSLFQHDVGRMVGFDVFTGICAGYCGILFILSLYFIYEHFKNHRKNKKDTLGPGVVGLSSLFLCLFMSVNPLGQRFPYDTVIFIFQSLWLNMSIAFTVCALTLIICNWLTVAYMAKGRVNSNMNWSTRVKVLFFIVSTLLITIAGLASGFGVLLSLSTEVFLTTIGGVTLILSTILLISSIIICRKTQTKAAAKKAIIIALCLILSIFVLVAMFIIRFLFKDSWELIFSLNLVVPSFILCFVQTIMLFNLRYKDYYQIIGSQTTELNVVSMSGDDNSFAEPFIDVVVSGKKKKNDNSSLFERENNYNDNGMFDESDSIEENQTAYEFDDVFNDSSD